MAMQLTGLIAATYTPMRDDGSIDLDAIDPVVERLLSDGVSGFYVCGSTGEGVSLTTEERKRVAERFIRAVRQRVPVVVQVGHNALSDACDLAAHAEQAGADAVSAVAPSYFPIDSVETLVQCMAAIADAATQVPFYYYHIPAVTGVDIDMLAFLRLAGDRIATLAGVKYTARTIHEYQLCIALEDGRFDMPYGYDEMLLPALAVGARGAVGSTFNIAAPLYQRVIQAFHAGDIEQARINQHRACEMIQVIGRYPFHPAVKAVMEMLNTPCGPCRLPLPPLSESQVRQLRDDLEAIGFFDWALKPIEV